MEENKGQSAGATRTQFTAVGDLRRSWQSWAEDHIDYQRQNPFSNDSKPVTKSVHPQRGDPIYGRPPEGSKTEQRGKDAHTHVGKEVEELCLIMRNIGEKGDDGNVLFSCLLLSQEVYMAVSAVPFAGNLEGPL
uniref:Uncharacterized protein n=1 Tax=Chelonoidis abingdonii TaxID=106734 RepID=A0A8C0H285_CHEAB